MPWGGSEKQQPACKRKQASKAHSVFCAQRLQWSLQFVLEEFLTGVLDRLCLRTDYGAVELDLNWAHPLEMLSLGQGDLTVTLRHWWKRQRETCRGLLRSSGKYGQVHWEDPLKASEQQYPEWYSRPAEITAKHTRNLPEESKAEDSSEEPSRTKRETYNRSKLFMGRGSLSVATPSRSCKVTLWTILVSLLLLSAMITGSPTPELSMEGHSSPEQDLDSLGNAAPSSVETRPEEDINIPVRSNWNSHYDNITSEGHSDDDLPDDLLFRAERSPESSMKPKKNKKKKSSNPGGKGCRLRNVMVKVRELGLGHDSDEQIVFKYCSGVCQKSRKNYDVTLSALLEKKIIPPGSQERVSSHPCCRPTKYENVSFMDVHNTWKVVDMLSAIECSCVG